MGYICPNCNKDTGEPEGYFDGRTGCVHCDVVLPNLRRLDDAIVHGGVYSPYIPLVVTDVIQPEKATGK